MRPHPRHHPTWLRTVLLTAVVVALAACGGDDDTGTGTGSDPASDGAGSTDAIVQIERSRYAPQEIRVVPGTTVAFENLDPYEHTVTSADGSSLEYDSGRLGEDEVFEQTFAETGSYDYFCEIHPTMRATVVVE